jgi:peptidylprolyl isomerase
MRNVRWLASLALVASLTAGAAPAEDPENTLLMELSSGQVTIALRPDLAPAHVARIKELTRKGYYDGLTFHRVIDRFMAQTGDPKGDGTGGSGSRLKAEFSKEPFERGTVGMARSRDPDSADSQFFICLGASPWLTGQYTAWGRVVEGMDHVDRIKKGDKARNGTVENPDRIVRLRVAADVKP